MPKTIPTVVISLIESHDRRRYMADQLSKTNVAYRFFDAQRFKEYPDAYDGVTRMRVHCNHLNLSEVGCYDSHYKIWTQLVESDDQMWCVLEDDVELGEGFFVTLSAIAAASFSFGVIRLCDAGAEDSWQVATLCDGRIVKDHRKQPFGTQGYVIHRDAARALLAYASRIVYTVDDLLNRDWEHRVRMLSVSPAVLFHRNDLLETTIGRNKARRSLFGKLKREFYMGRDSLNRRLYAFQRRWMAYQDGRKSGTFKGRGLFTWMLLLLCSMEVWAIVD